MTHENGKPYTEIDNEMIEALLLIKTTKRKLKIMLEVCRLLNGFHRSGDKIPLSQFKEDTGIEKGNISKPLKECIEENMLILKDSFLYLQEDIMKWAGVIKLITSDRLSKRLRKVINLRTKKVINLDPSKETLKATIKERVLSKSQREEKRKEYKTGLAMLKEAIKRSPDRKRKSH